MNQLKRVFNALLLIGFFFLVSCTNHTDIHKTNSTFYLVRPAEHYPAFNGHLTWYGRLRAGDLMRCLKDSGIQKIYVTPFSRSVETIDSLRISERIDTVEYIIDSSGATIMRLLQQKADFGKKVLIVARPYAIPNIIRLLGSHLQDTLPNEGFNIIYKVINDHGKARLEQKIFGGLPRPVADTAMR